MWNESKKIVKKLDRVIQIESAYVLGSFTVNKKRPADVDFILLLKTKENKQTKWSVDLVIAPDNEYGI